MRPTSSKTKGPPRRLAGPAVVAAHDADGDLSPLGAELVRGLKLVHDLRGSLAAILLMLDLAARAQAEPARRRRVQRIASSLRAHCDELTTVTSLLASGAEATDTALCRARPDAEA